MAGQHGTMFVLLRSKKKCLPQTKRI